MKDYICKDCGHNNHGWCKEFLRQVDKTQAECASHFNKNGTHFRIERTSSDYLGQQLVSIEVNGQVAEFPETILADFINQKECRLKEFTIPGK
jgi:hypothetical protein